MLQAIVAVAALLFDAGVITPPAPRPRYEQQQYGQYGGPGPYYGQPQQHGPPQQQARSSSSVRDTRRSTAAATRVAPSTGGFSGGPAERAPDAADRFPDLRPAAVEFGPDDTGAGAAARHPRSPAPRRRNLSRACVNFARVSVRGERPN